jgi:hypothetical protein
MIEYALLIMLGFFIGGLIAFLLAPTLWSRAVRLTTKRLEATMPMSLSEIEADKDLLRASYAIRIRRLEAGLNKARDKSANQLVHISKLQMQIAEMNHKIAALNAELDERRNAANVFESTIRKRFPELEYRVAIAKAALDDRMIEITDLNNKLTRREETLAMLQRSANLQQEEIARLRETLKKSGSHTTGRFKLRPSQWTLNDYRSEYDRLNVELSKMREQLILSRERETRQIGVLKTELQQLAERIMSSVSSSAPQNSNWRDDDGGAASDRSYTQNRPSTSTPVTKTASSAPKPPVWHSRTASPASSASGVIYNRRTTEVKPAAAGIRPHSPAPRADREDHQAGAAIERPVPAEKKIASEKTSEKAKEDQKEQQNAQNELNSLLARSVRFADKHLEQPEQRKPSAEIEYLANDVPDLQEAAGEPDSKNLNHGSPSQAAASDSKPLESTPAIATGTKTEPKLDKVFREILEGPTAPEAAASPATSPHTGPQAGVQGDGSSAEDDGAGSSSSASETATQTLLDRLRILQNRQTG